MTDDPIAILAASREREPEPSGRPHLWPLIIITMVLMSLAVAFFGKRDPMPLPTDPVTSETPTPAPVARVYVVSYRFGVFSPTNLRIHAGDTVRFRNDSPLPIHIVADLQAGERNPEFDSVGNVEPGSYFSYTFARVGIFGYQNAADHTQSGVIIVR